MNTSYLIVAPHFPIKEVYTYLVAVKTQVIVFLVISSQVREVERVTQENPTPAKIGSHFDAGFRREYHLAVILMVAELIHLVGVGALQHSRKVVMLWLHIVRVDPAKLLNKFIQHSSFEEKRLADFDV